MQADRIDPRVLICYSAFAIPLALAALPVYVYAPALYAEREHLPLAQLGAALLAARLFDALIDPMLGRWVDSTRGKGYRRHISLALPLLGGGFVALFNPPLLDQGNALVWLLASLMLVHWGHSLGGIAYQSWGASLAHLRSQRALVAGSREACGLLGVIAAAVLPAAIGLPGLCIVFLLALAAAAWLLLGFGARAACAAHDAAEQSVSAFLPLTNPVFRKLLAVFICNGIAAAIPATLFSFFARDRLQLGGTSGFFLAAYFLAGAASMPLWIMLARRHGEARAWLFSMLLALLAFCGAYTLGPGDVSSFALICVMSGLALGADLALPPALLTAVIHRAGHGGQREGSYFGLWNWATKMNLAIAAGAALPVLAWLGYTPGHASAQGQHALSLAYAALPCAFKAAALALLAAFRFDDT
ncbi:MAG: MFS transporter [Burkholderiaceae bacterium]|nr:MFS transporter [Burkholderiaceae bacterium]